MVKLIATLSTLGFTFQQRLRREETGATAVEYALLVGFMAVLIIVGLTAFGKDLGAFFTGLAAKTFNKTPA